MSLEWRLAEEADSGRGGRGGMNRNGRYHNGVDISNLTRSYTNDEWRKLSPEIIKEICDARDAHETGKAFGGDAKKRNVAAVVAEQEVEVAESPNEDHQENGSNGMAFGSGAYPNKRRAVVRQQDS
jgi:hypothetical protein